tara:strand:+ start:9411 stop:10487 length:1077 start_codon:yes stop_codon:yes gene_type:complete
MSTIYFICPDSNKPAGGIKKIYRQVDILNEAGFSASVLHEMPDFRCNWFKNNTKISYNRSIYKDLYKKINRKKGLLLSIKKSIQYLISSLTKKNNSVKARVNKNDILVFPELFGNNISDIKRGIKKVIYNQGCYQTFFGYNLDLKNLETPYLESDFIATIVNSDDAVNYIKHVFPKIKLFKIRHGLDVEKFNFKEKKLNTIAYMPRKLRNDLVQVINILKFRGVLNNWHFIEIDKMTEEEVAKKMQESTFFINFSGNEGFGIPVIEAMACGCVVLGYSGKGGNEFFKKEFSYKIEDGNVQEFSRTLEQVLLKFETEKSKILNKGLLASKFVLNEYSLKNEVSDTIKVWNEILKLKDDK